jgi:hypothetical protein
MRSLFIEPKIGLVLHTVKGKEPVLNIQKHQTHF